MVDALGAMEVTRSSAMSPLGHPGCAPETIEGARPPMEGGVRMKVKVCGITNVNDAAMCEEEGVDALGFVHIPGHERSLPLREIGDICSTVGPWATRVLICRPNGPRQAIRMLEDSGADVLQTYSMPPMFLSRLKDEGVRVIRVVGPDEGEARMYADHVDAIVFEGATSGTERDYSKMPIGSCRRAIVAGVTSDCIDAIRALRPYGVDVSSGVESSPGVKDRALVRALVRRCNA